MDDYRRHGWARLQGQPRLFLENPDPPVALRPPGSFEAAAKARLERGGATSRLPQLTDPGSQAPRADLLLTANPRLGVRPFSLPEAPSAGGATNAQPSDVGAVRAAVAAAPQGAQRCASDGQADEMRQWDNPHVIARWYTVFRELTDEERKHNSRCTTVLCGLASYLESIGKPHGLEEMFHDIRKSGTPLRLHQHACEWRELRENAKRPKSSKKHISLDFLEQELKTLIVTTAPTIPSLLPTESRQGTNDQLYESARQKHAWTTDPHRAAFKNLMERMAEFELQELLQKSTHGLKGNRMLELIVFPFVSNGMSVEAKSVVEFRRAFGWDDLELIKPFKWSSEAAARPEIERRDASGHPVASATNPKSGRVTGSER